MTRALVLGGGGPVGIAWETGLVVGLAERGIDLAAADRIVGTSAGSVVGAQLGLGIDLVERAKAIYPEPGAVPAADRATAAEVDPAAAAKVMQMMEAVGRLSPEPTAPDAEPEPAMAELGLLAREAETFPEEGFLALFADLAGVEWPERFACTAVDTATGRFTVWERSSGVPLQHAVASSCSVPFVYPPITIGGSRYMDGGMRSALNADLGAGHDAVVVVSCMADPPPGTAYPVAVREARFRNAALEAMAAAGSTVGLVLPGAEFLEVSGAGLLLMDARRAPAAYAAGLRQAADEAGRLAEVWG